MTAARHGDANPGATIGVGVTTSADRLSRPMSLLAAAGLRPVALPCIEVVAAEADVLAAVRHALGYADLMLATSARVIDLLYGPGDPPPVPVAAVGTATAAAVEATGGEVVAIGAGGAMALAAELAERARDRIVVYPHAAGAEPKAARLVAGVAKKVIAAPIYRTQSIPPGDDSVDAVLFASPSAVEGWAMRRSLDVPVVGAIGETTAQALRELGRAPDVVPDRPGFAELVTALVRYLRDNAPGGIR